MTSNKNDHPQNNSDKRQLSDDERREKGLALVQTLFKGAEVNGQSMSASLGDFTLRHLFGDVWQQNDMALQQRSLITCTILVALNRTEEQRVHFLGAKNVGVDRKVLEGMITHSAYYAGWPCAVSAGRILNEVWPEDD